MKTSDEIHVASYCREFAAEMLALDSIAFNRAQLESTDVDSGNNTTSMLFVKSCIMGRGIQGQFQQSILLPMQQLLKSRELRFSTLGRDVGLTLTADHGPCPNRKERLGLHPTAFTSWRVPQFHNLTLLMHEGSLYGSGCYNSSKHVTIPTAAGSLPLDMIQCHSALEPGATQRPNLVFYSGKGSSGVRSKIEKQMKKHELSAYNNSYLAYNDYICAMHRSEFCMAPRGNAVWSPRLEESIACGCIPIVVADKYELPFHRILNYSMFSLRISQENIGSLASIINKVSVQEREELRRNCRKVFPFFRYWAPNFRSTGSEHSLMDASTLILFELWAQRHQPQLFTTHSTESEKEW
eukprot:m.121351 g.121351  ORF g.121351 m.121351 type:complete len:353 (-) comp14389_c0_seq4:2530-3588(-)